MRRILAGALLGLFPMLPGALGQSPDGPMAPSPDTPVERPRPQSEPRLKVRVSLVNTPVTVRDSRGEMIHDLEERNFRITDNGVGYDPGVVESRPGHLGLVLMRERPLIAGGWCRIESAPGAGTEVAFWVPSDTPAEPETAA